ncbi:MAG: hypothetical protein WAO08_03925 [Hyphomicrobiaceae bacterium]
MTKPIEARLNLTQERQQPGRVQFKEDWLADRILQWARRALHDVLRLRYVARVPSADIALPNAGT